MTSPRSHLSLEEGIYTESGSMGGSFTSYHCSYYKVELTDWDLSEDYQVKFGDLIFQFQLQIMRPIPQHRDWANSNA